MKRLLFLFVLIACVSTADAYRYYCVLNGYDNAFSGKSTVWFDFGRNHTYRARPNIFEDTELIDKDGKTIKLNNLVDAMNYMSERGWIFQQAYTTVSDGDTRCERWILYKDADTKEEASEGIITKEEFEMQK